MPNAIICLTRGYSHTSKYDMLIQRNKALYEFFGKKYDYVIFHEGNIDLSHRKYLQRKSRQTLIFKDISNIWKGGYEGMCRFYSLDVFNECKEYDYILRVDEDCLLLSLKGDPFDNVGENVYLKSLYWGESHSETNATLPQKLEQLTGAKREDFYNNKFPYTNIGISKVKFWLEDPVYSALKEVATCQDQRTNRWGDLPIHGALLNIFAKGKVGQIEGIRYNHISHGFTVNQNGLDKKN